MKTLGLIAVLAASAVFAGDAVSVGPEELNEHNAHWQIVTTYTVGCVRDGRFVYGCNDAASMMWNGQPINIGGYDGVRIYIYYSLKTADEGDYCQLWLGENGNWDLFHTFEETNGISAYAATLDDYYGVNDLKILFMWVSDETGVDEGFRMIVCEIRGVHWGEGDYTNIFTWTSPDVTGHQIHNLSGMSDRSMACLAFTYETWGDSQGWWAIDNVALDADGDSVLPLQGGGYGTEDFSSGGWYQDSHGMDGSWEIDTDHNAGDMSGENWQADAGAHPGWQYNAETRSPWIAASRMFMIACSFDTWWDWMVPGDRATLGYYEAVGHTIFDPKFNDLDDWLIADGGEDVVETSWGQIKADF